MIANTNSSGPNVEIRMEFVPSNLNKYASCVHAAVKSPIIERCGNRERSYITIIGPRLIVILCCMVTSVRSFLRTFWTIEDSLDHHHKNSLANTCCTTIRCTAQVV